MNPRPVAVAVAIAACAALAACGAHTTEARRAPAPPPLPPSATAAPAPAPPAEPPEPPGIRDGDLGLARGSVFEAAAPPAFQPERSEPGEKPVVPRAFVGTPPVIPHEVTDYTPITRKQNGCLDCHQIPGPKEAGQPTPVPPSHYLDPRAPGKPLKTVAGARWVCTSCHVPRSDQGPLVRNPGP